MKKINVKLLIGSFLIGIVLGTITEYSLIYNVKWLINITQSFIFWGIIMLIISVFSKEYINSILASSITMAVMTATYYLIRLIISGYTNIGAWKMYTILGICASIYIGMGVYCIKRRFNNKKEKDYIPTISLILMTIFSIILTIIDIYGMYNRILIFGNYSYNPSIVGIIIGIIFGTIIGKHLNNKIKMNSNTNLTKEKS